MTQAEATHMLLHALAEDSVQQDLDQAHTQLEVYHVLQRLAYFDMTPDEFRISLTELSQIQEEK